MFGLLPVFLLTAVAAAQVIVDDPVIVDEAPLRALVSQSGISLEHLQRVRQVLSSRVQPVVNDATPALQEKIDKIILNNEGYKQSYPDIIDLNAPLQSYLYKGDLLLTEEQLNMLEKETETRLTSRARRFAPMNWAGLWDTSKPIPYRIESSLGEDGKTAVAKAIEILSSRSCLSFVNNPSSNYGLSFFSGPGCYSYIGQTRGWQQVSIGRGCEISSIATHEILHALGSDHEQDRADRNNYVKINENVVPKDKMNNFELRMPDENNNQGVPYDFGSIMHYGAFDFSTVAGSPSIVAKDILYTQTMGQRRFIAFNDLKTLNKLYKCNDKCGSPPSCQNGGYVHPKDCSKCMCNDFYKGNLCEIPVTTHDVSVGKTLQLEYASKDKNIYQPYAEYTDFDKIAPKIFFAPAGKRLSVKITALSAYNTCTRGCPFVGIEVVEGDDLTRGGKTFCCGTDIGKTFTTNTNTLGLKAFNFPGERFNFTLEVRAV